MTIVRKPFLMMAAVLCIAANAGCGGSSGYTSDGITTYLPAPIPYPTSVLVGCQPGTLTAVISVRQDGYSGPFTAQSRDTTVAKVALGPGNTQFTVSRASPTSGGTTQIYILGGGLQPAIVDVNVSAC